jgi:hypothetical protein
VYTARFTPEAWPELLASCPRPVSSSGALDSSSIRVSSSSSPSDPWATDCSSPKEISGELLNWVPPEGSPPVSSEDIFSLSVEMTKNRFPRTYFFPKIYEGKKNEKEEGINTTLRQ